MQLVPIYVEPDGIRVKSVALLHDGSQAWKNYQRNSSFNGLHNYHHLPARIMATTQKLGQSKKNNVVQRFKQ
jgi:hypothetical protein